MKLRPSKLDPFIDQLLAMNDKNETLDQMRLWLKGKGVSAALPTISEFLARSREQRLQRELLNQITSGGEAVRETENGLRQNSAPKLDTLIKLVRTLILHITTQGVVDITLLKQVTPLMKIAIQCDNYSRSQYSAQQMALEVCLEEAKQFPEVAQLFQQAFDALKRAKATSQMSERGVPA